MREPASAPPRSRASASVHARTAANLRAVLLADAIFELVLGVALIVCALTGRPAALELPWPASRSIVAGFGFLLLPVAFVLWGVARTPLPARSTVLALAVANGLTAAVLLVWFVGSRGGGLVGWVLIGGTSLALAVLAVLELKVLPPPPAAGYTTSDVRG